MRKEFIPVLDDDRNRADTISELRFQFEESEGGLVDGPPSVLEVIFCLAQQAEFWAAGSGNDQGVRAWFWEFIGNLGVDSFDDEEWYEINAQGFTADRIDDWLLRDYDYDGSGGLFPLREPSCDQRFSDLWTQLGDYVMERTDIL